MSKRGNAFYAAEDLRQKVMRMPGGAEWLATRKAIANNNATSIANKKKALVKKEHFDGVPDSAGREMHKKRFELSQLAKKGRI